MQTLRELLDTITINAKWLDTYKKDVPLFIQEASKGQNWNEWEPEIFKKFFDNLDQCVCQLAAYAYFSDAERNVIKDNWRQLAPLFKELADNQDTPKFDIYKVIDEIIKGYTKRHMRAATRRLIAALQPKLLTTLISKERLNQLFRFLKENTKEGSTLPKLENNWYKDSHQLFNFFAEHLRDYTPKIPSGSPIDLVTNSYMNLMTYPWEIVNKYLTDKPAKSESEDGVPEMNDDTNELVNRAIQLLEEKKQIILQGPPGTGKTYTAKDIAEKLVFNTITDDKNTQATNLSNSAQYKFIQFHPSYSYEDFVRGIVVKTEGQHIKYCVENKPLADFAEKAYINYINSKKEQKTISKEKWVDEKFELFLEKQREIFDDEEKISLQNSIVSIVDIQDDAFRYAGNPQYNYRMLFKDIKTAYIDGCDTRESIVNNEKLSKSIRPHSIYLRRVVNQFKLFLKDNNLTFNDIDISNDKEEELNYVLIIDEINRANLPVVLGELIYALEYRGEAVDSLYAKEDESRLILPPNLYIIGTMNTADRSVGTIDYAIRRRFSFCKILPQILDNGCFNKSLFEKISRFFVKNYSIEDNANSCLFERSEYLSEEFDPEDVWIGHSYFIMKNEAHTQIRIAYEIIPLLHEYVKDGILKETALDVIKELANPNLDVGIDQ